MTAPAPLGSRRLRPLPPSGVGPLYSCRSVADDQDVEIALLIAVLLVGFGFALAVSYGVLALVLGSMVGQRPSLGVTVRWHRVAFAAGLFWLWYLVPGLAAAADHAGIAVVFRRLLGE